MALDTYYLYSLIGHRLLKLNYYGNIIQKRQLPAVSCELVDTAAAAAAAAAQLLEAELFRYLPGNSFERVVNVHRVDYHTIIFYLWSNK